MATIGVAPYVMRNALLQIATDNYEKHISGVTLTPAVTAVKFKGIDGSVNTDTSAPEWSAQLTYAQDWATTNSLSKYLATNAGTVKTVVFSPLGTTAGKPKCTIDVVLAPGPIGGSVDEMQTASVTLSCNGQPVWTVWP